MVRDGMDALITRLRRLVNDTSDSIWSSDDALQDVLDEHKERVYREPLEYERTLVAAGSAVYRVYHSRYTDFEGGGTAYFQLEDASGTQRGTGDYTVDYVHGVVTMNADQLGTALYLTGWTYDLNGAAADLWRERAGQLAEHVDVQSGDNRLSRSQMMAHALEMADHYAQRSRARTVRSWTNGLFKRD